MHVTIYHRMLDVGASWIIARIVDHRTSRFTITSRMLDVDSWYIIARCDLSRRFVLDICDAL
jgi:hypothetical protein